MSFLKNFRNSVSRKSSSNSRGSSLVRIGPESDYSRKSCSDFRGILKQKSQKQDEQGDGLHRSDTFTIYDEDSILSVVKRPAKQSMFGKFSTFTRKKKSAHRNEEISSKESNLSNSYKRWPTPSDPAITVSNDPFGVLYGQNSPNPSLKVDRRTSEKSTVDYGTYRKSKVSNTINVKDQIEQIQNDQQVPNEQNEDPDKFRTITINSFRKSFRKKFLTQQKDVPHNPAWFIEVDPPKDKDNDKDHKIRPDLIIYENENYRPNTRSPVRGLDSSQKQNNENDRASRSPIRGMDSGQKQRTSVRRNETFRVENENCEPSIRIEIKNSIQPHQPGRMVPVGVAKPMQSDRSNIIQRTWIEQGKDPSNQHNLYQTTIQINNEHDRGYNSPRFKRATENTPFRRNPSTRIQINGSGRYPQSQKPTPYIANYSPLTSYEMLSKLKHRPEPIYYGDNRQRSQSGKLREVTNVQQYENRRINQPSSGSTISSRQRNMPPVMEHPVRKEINVNRIPANNASRRQSNKAPWR